MRIREEIRTFLKEQIDNYNLEDHQDLFALGLVNSMFAMQLVLMVEQKFGITIDGDDLNLDYFRSVDAITNLVTRKLEG
jgi:methoxymalonate biosynthesis acyl carrier protein